MDTGGDSYPIMGGLGTFDCRVLPIPAPNQPPIPPTLPR